VIRSGRGPRCVNYCIYQNPLSNIQKGILLLMTIKVSAAKTKLRTPNNDIKLMRRIKKGNEDAAEKRQSGNANIPIGANQSIAYLFKRMIASDMMSLTFAPVLRESNAVRNENKTKKNQKNAVWAQKTKLKMLHLRNGARRKTKVPK
jgi:hypothetical protein